MRTVAEAKARFLELLTGVEMSRYKSANRKRLPDALPGLHRLHA